MLYALSDISATCMLFQRQHRNMVRVVVLDKVDKHMVALVCVDHRVPWQLCDWSCASTNGVRCDLLYAERVWRGCAQVGGTVLHGILVWYSVIGVRCRALGLFQWSERERIK